MFAEQPAGILAPAEMLQGQITSFNATTGANIVQVMGATLTNLPLAVTGAEVGYQAGDVVMLQRLSNTYIIAYKVSPVGGPTYASAATASFGYFGNTGNQNYTGPGQVSLATAQIQVPVWANRMAFMGAAEVSFKNGSSGADTDCTVQHIMNGNSSGSFLDWVSAGSHNQKFEKFQSGVQIVVPGSTITATCAWSANVTVAGLINASQVAGVCLFSKV
jgi:hypothetical protein